MVKVLKRLKDNLSNFFLVIFVFAFIHFYLFYRSVLLVGGQNTRNQMQELEYGVRL